MVLRATPVLDTALRVILSLAKPGNDDGLIPLVDTRLIALIAETAIAYIEMPAPVFQETEDL